MAAEKDNSLAAPAQSQTVAQASPAGKPSSGFAPSTYFPRQSPALRALREEFASQLAEALGGCVAGPWRVQLVGASLSTREQFTASVEEATCCFELPGTSSFLAAEFTPSIAFPALNRLMGGSNQDAYIPRRPLTEIERRVLGRLADVVGNCLKQFVPQGLPGTAPPGEPPADDHEVLSASFELVIGEQTGTLRLCLPTSVLTPASENAAAASDSVLEISASLAEIDLDAADLGQLATGDILTTDTPLDGEIIIRVAGIPKFVGRLGTMNGRRAVTIVRRI